MKFPVTNEALISSLELWLMMLFFYPTCSSCERMLVRGDWGEMLCPPTVLQQNKCYEVCWIFRCVANYWPMGSPWHTEDNVGECVSQVNRWVSEPASQSGKKCACNRNTNVYSLNTGCFRAITISIIFATSILSYLFMVSNRSNIGDLSYFSPKTPFSKFFKI